MEMLSVDGLCKKYPSFELKNVSFKLEAGYIMGFVGRNGAGKTTTLKSMMNLVHRDGGAVSMFGKDFYENEISCKQRIGFMLGGMTSYPKKKLAALAYAEKRFYTEWDDNAFTRYMKEFGLDLNKRIEQLSDGMRVKFSLALALSHNASLFVLDEPTSGLDPVSRDEILDIFRGLISEGDRSILFSTHITSDLEKCADYITYIKDGEVIESGDMPTLLDSYKIIAGEKGLFEKYKSIMIGSKTNMFGFSALVRTRDVPNDASLTVSPSDIESIMIYHERKA